MRPVDRYIHEVLGRVFAAPEDRQRLETDLRAHFEEALARGETAAQVIERMGEPGQVAAAFNAERPLRYAGFWRRVVAFLGDMGAIVALLLPLLTLLLLLLPRIEATTGAAPLAWMASLLLVLAVTGIFILYFPILEARFGKTLGKQLLHIRVVREDATPIGAGQAFIRRLSFYFEFLVPDALFVPFTEKRQRALDIVAKTVVAREPGTTTPWWGWAACLLLPVLSFSALLLVARLCATP